MEAGLEDGRKGQSVRSTENHNCIAQLSLAGLAWVTALALLSSPLYAAERIDGEPIQLPGTNITIYTPDYVLANFTHREGGRLVFTDRHGVAWRLVEDPASDVISNKGDGAFHPCDPLEVGAACEGIDYRIEDLDVEIFVMPFPREDLLDCSAEEGAIYLSPGMYEVPPEHVHMVVAHELGHCVQCRFMPEDERQLWARYKGLRGIGNAGVYNVAAPHARQPREIFAEDFRWLFGDDLSKYSGTIENRDLDLPDRIPGLRAFFVSLAETHLARAGGSGNANAFEITNYPNPFSTVTTVSLKIADTFNASNYVLGSTTVGAVVFDACGRAVKDLGSRSLGGGSQVQFRWDGTDTDGRRLASGVYFLRVRLDGAGGASAHKMLLRR
jgi:hypothetical protein